MELLKTDWRLVIYILSLIFISILGIFIFPSSLLQCVIGLSIFTVIFGLRIGFKNSAALIKPTATTKTSSKWLLPICAWIFLWGLSGIFFIFLTASSELPAQEITFGVLLKTWRIDFLMSLFLLLTQIIIATVYREQYPKMPKVIVDSSPILFQLSALVALIVSLITLIFAVANGLARIMGFSVTPGVEFQNLLGSVLICLPLMQKYLRRKRGVYIPKGNNAYRQLILAIGTLIISVTVISLLTLPFMGIPITTPLIKKTGLSMHHWQLLILAWQLGMTPFLAARILSMSYGKNLLQMIVACGIAGALAYLLCNLFLTHLGSDYFLAVLLQGPLALILATAPILTLTFSALRFYGETGMIAKPLDLRKLQRNEKHLMPKLVQAMVLACVLYWPTGLSILFVCLSMLAIPSLLMFFVAASFFL
jgi:hypothetical protein